MRSASPVVRGDQMQRQIDDFSRDVRAIRACKNRDSVGVDEFAKRSKLVSVMASVSFHDTARFADRLIGPLHARRSRHAIDRALPAFAILAVVMVVGGKFRGTLYRPRQVKSA